MNLVATEIETGRQLWTVQLGTPQNANNNPYGRGGFSFGGPKILSGGGMLFVATNNGALLAVSIAGRQVEWALQHDTKPQMGNQRFWINGMMVAPTESPGTLLDSDGVFYVKDASSHLMYVVDPAGPSVKWKRSISADESVVTISNGTAYLVGGEISALDLKSRKLLWSTKLPQGRQSEQSLVCLDHIYVPTARGIFDIDPSNGDIRRIFRGADRDSGAARLILAGDKLIAISDTAVTAYTIERPKVPKITSRTPQ
jgi:outer membrane protein assembly factor BamB